MEIPPIQTVPERMFWPEVFQQPLPMVGIPANRLFPGISRDRFYNFFSDWHLNHNGKSLFYKDRHTRITEALWKIRLTPEILSF